MNLPASCVIIADDLTGACDSALQFRNRGVPALVHMGRDAEIALEGIHAFSTETRGLEARETQARIEDIARRLNGQPRTVFKKIDSLLRGAPGVEILAALDAFQSDVAVITPSFPELGRRVVDGRLYVDGDVTWMPVDVPALFREQGLEECQHIAPGVLGHALAAGHRSISIDSATKEDLRVIAREASRCDRKVLWVGSAGLAAALAEILTPEPTTQVLHSPSSVGPVLFIIGSEHPVTAAQMSEAIGRHVAVDLHAAEAHRGLAAGKNVLVRVDLAHGSSLNLHMMLADAATYPGAVFVSGGDTASLVCRALEVSGIQIEGQIAPGVPWGVLQGGPLDGIPIVTKSGAFGEPDILIKTAEFFACPQQ